MVAVKNKVSQLVTKQRIKNFIKKSFIGGLTVIVPLAAILAIFSWLWKLTVSYIHPLTALISDKSGMHLIFSELLSLIMISAVCFFIGAAISTNFGKWFHDKFDVAFSKLAPGYKMLKGVISQLLDSESSSSFINGTPVFVFPYGKGHPLSMTGYIAAEDKVNNIVSIYTPIPMNPSSGLTFHVPRDWIIEMEGVSNEDVLRTIIGFGTGSNELLAKTPDIFQHYNQDK